MKTRFEASLPYGRDHLLLRLQSGSLIGPRSVPSAPEAVQRALAAPIGTPRLSVMARPGQRIAILVSDVTRCCPTPALLGPVIDELQRAGIRDEDVTIVIARGVHRAHDEDERRRLVGEAVARRFRVIDSDPEDVEHVGTTQRGTPIEIFGLVLACDLRVGLGNVEVHYFAGYTGGAKALVPGVCSRATISANHALVASPNARAGLIEGNPVREDLEEAATRVGLQFIVNVVLDHTARIVEAVAGDVIEAHRVACRFVDGIARPLVAAAADVVVVSPGGHPKDINLYQAQKALETAAALVRPGGIIVWVAECPEGFGHPLFEEWLAGRHPLEVLARLRTEFTLGGHKAAAVARVLLHARVWLVSSMPADRIEACGIRAFERLAEAVAAVHADLPGASILVLPDGSGLLPTLAPAIV